MFFGFVSYIPFTKEKFVIKWSSYKKIFPYCLNPGIPSTYHLHLNVIVGFLTTISFLENSPHHHPSDAPLRIHTFPTGVWLCCGIELPPIKNQNFRVTLGYQDRGVSSHVTWNYSSEVRPRLSRKPRGGYNVWERKQQNNKQRIQCLLWILLSTGSTGVRRTKRSPLSHVSKHWRVWE